MLAFAEKSCNEHHGFLPLGEKMVFALHGLLRSKSICP